MKPGRKRTSSFQKAATFEQELFENRRIKSELADVLISLWSWGKISAAHVQEVAQAALKDAQMHTADFNIYDWEVLSKLGSGGHKKQNIARDLGKKLPPALCQISDHRIPVKVAVSKGISRVAQVSIPFILPGEIWKSAWAHRHVWRQHICNCEDSIVEFWSQCGNHPALQRHPCKSIPRYDRRAIPVVLHGDGASVTQQLGSAAKSCLFVSWRSLLVPEHHFLTTALWTTMKADSMVGSTVKSLYRFVASSFQMLLQDEGKDTNGYFPVVVFSTGDIEFFNQWHLCPQWNSTKPCPLCPVHQHRLADFREVCKLTADTWPDQRPSQTFCLFETLMSPRSIMPDYMHCKHLGLDSRFLGSVCWLLVFKLMDQRLSLDERLARLLFQIQDSCLTKFYLYIFWSMSAVFSFLPLQNLRKLGHLEPGPRLAI